MKYRANSKPTIMEEEFINWAAISKKLTGGTDRIRKNRIPKAHQDRIEELLRYIKAWEEGKRLFTQSEILESISNIDLKTIIQTDLGIQG